MEQARSHYEKAKALFEIVGDMRLTQQVVQNLDNLYEYDYSVSKLFDKSGIVSQEHYKADLILDFLQKNLEFTLRQGDERRNANIYFNLGNLHCKLGDRDLARVHYEKAKALYQMVGDAQKAQVVAQALRGL
jgi:tetratricopeptide (TPR) repeat protein